MLLADPEAVILHTTEETPEAVTVHESTETQERKVLEDTTSHDGDQVISDPTEQSSPLSESSSSRDSCAETDQPASDQLEEIQDEAVPDLEEEKNENVESSSPREESDSEKEIAPNTEDGKEMLFLRTIIAVNNIQIKQLEEKIANDEQKRAQMFKDEYFCTVCYAVLVSPCMFPCCSKYICAACAFEISKKQADIMRSNQSYFIPSVSCPCCNHLFAEHDFFVNVLRPVTGLAFRLLLDAYLPVANPDQDLKCSGCSVVYRDADHIENHKTSRCLPMDIMCPLCSHTKVNIRQDPDLTKHFMRCQGIYRCRESCCRNGKRDNHVYAYLAAFHKKQPFIDRIFYFWSKTAQLVGQHPELIIPLFINLVDDESLEVLKRVKELYKSTEALVKEKGLNCLSLDEVLTKSGGL